VSIPSKRINVLQKNLRFLISSAGLARTSIPPASEAGFHQDAFSKGLEHPLPAGMRDLLPGEAGVQASLVRRLIGAFELCGYELVTVPIFEYATVLARGLGSLGEHEILRFVEPETGAIVVLRPDMTAQIARVVATRLASAPVPARLCYQGSVLRRRHERARRQRQIPQAGIELVGTGGTEADLEVLGVATRAARQAGLDDFTLDLGHAGIAGALLAGVPDEHQRDIVEALGIRDSAEIARRAEGRGLEPEVCRALASLPELFGAVDVLPRAEKALGQTPARAAFIELRALADAVSAHGVAPKVVVDFAETRDLAYYTGAVFSILAAGPGRAVGVGGRYDGLGERFGRGGPAAGFAFDLDHLGWALAHAGRVGVPPARLLVTHGDGGVLAALRECRLACAPAPPGDPLAYARAWRYTHLVEITFETATLVRVADLGRTALPRDPRALGVATAALLQAETLGAEPSEESQ
jgi:ATP phosphoribosyltransferase regulatory subunit